MDPLPLHEELALTSASADLDASIAELSIHLAQLYLESARTYQRANHSAAAARDKSRAESLYRWAVEAAESTNSADQDVLRPELAQVKTELDSLELSSAAGAQ